MRVLVVDDNRDAAAILTRLLEISGHDPRSANNGERALQVAAEFLPEAVLLDIGVPDVNGYAVAKCLREMPALQGVRIAIVSGYTANKAMQFECGIDCHLLKPVSIDGILKAIGAGPLPAV